MTASGGMATFTDLTLNKVGTGYTLQASTGTLSSVTTSGFNVTPAAATQFVIAASGEPPASVNAGQSFPMVVDAEDQFGNLATGFTAPVTIAAPSNVIGATPITAMAAWRRSSLAIDTAGTYQLTGHQHRTDLGHLNPRDGQPRSAAGATGVGHPSPRVQSSTASASAHGRCGGPVREHRDGL